jgi:hypothetical protein
MKCCHIVSYNTAGWKPTYERICASVGFLSWMNNLHCDVLALQEVKLSHEQLLYGDGVGRFGVGDSLPFEGFFAARFPHVFERDVCALTVFLLARNGLGSVAWLSLCGVVWCEGHQRWLRIVCWSVVF